MKRCPQCNRTFEEDDLVFCLYDGRSLEGTGPSATTTRPPSPSKGTIPWYLLGGIVGATVIFLVILSLLQRAGTSASVNAVLAAVRRADAAEVQAVRTLDTSVLSTSYTGAALAQEQAMVENLRQRAVYLNSRLLATNVAGIVFDSNRRTARVRLTETWGSTLYSVPTGQPIRALSQSVVPQTVLLQRDGDDWLVFSDIPGD